MNNYCKNTDWWTRERVDNGLRRFVRDYAGGDEKNLPLTLYAYRAAMPADERRHLLQSLKLYPPFLAVLRHYSSFFAAWRANGFAVEFRRSKTAAAELAGIQFGFLTAIRYSHSTPGSSRIWECRCRCGKKTFVSAKNLIRGKSASCGCYRRNVLAIFAGYKNFKNIAGEKFGRLTARRAVGKYQNMTLWECECECGKTSRVPVSSLTRGVTRSCGCLRNEKSLERLAVWRKEKRRAA